MEPRSEPVATASVIGRRAHRQGLGEPLPGLAEAARAMVGVHAQVAAAAALSLSARVAGFEPGDAAAATAADGPLVKTYGPRGTVHLLLRDDLALWCAALSALPTTTSQPPGVGLDDAQRDAVVAAIADALGDPGVDAAGLDLAQLDAAVVARTGDWAGELSMPAFGGAWPRWRQAIGTAAHRGVLVFGAGRGRTMTYRHPRIGELPDADTATGWLLDRYLRSYGPATPAEFARWLATTPARVREALARHPEFVEPIATDLGERLIARGDDAFDAPAPPGVRLLGHFDAYVVGAHPRTVLYPGAAADRALHHGQAGTLPVILVDGVVGGVWHARRATRRLEMTVEPFGRFGAARRRELERDAERVAHATGLPLELRWGAVSAKPHA